MTDVSSLILIRPSLAELRRQAAADLIQANAATEAPLACWSAVSEAPDRFAARVGRLRANWDGRILAVIPHAYPTPDNVERVELTAKAHAALHPTCEARNVVLRGGRGGSKSWAVARVLVLEALSEPKRYLCLREIQRSLKDSSLRLLADQIDMLNLSRYFEVLANSITSHAGASFLFEGMYQNVQRIKSLEGVDCAWIEQAEQLSEESWSVLLPTIRKPGSRIILTLNPDLSDDPSFKRFVTNAPPNTIGATMSYIENPWASPEMLAEAEYLRSVDVEAFDHIWGGACREHSDAQVFKGKYSVESFEIDASWSVFFGADWGFASDPTVLLRAFVDQKTQTLYVSDEAYGRRVDLDATPALFDQVPGARKHTIRADNSRPETISHMQSRGFSNLTACQKWPNCAEDGIAVIRQFRTIKIHPRCERTAEEFKMFSYKVDRLSGDVLPELRSGFDHCIDALRYALEPVIRRAGGAGIRDFYAGLLNGAKQPTDPVSATPAAQAALLIDSMTATHRTVRGTVRDLPLGAPSGAYQGSFER